MQVIARDLWDIDSGHAATAAFFVDRGNAAVAACPEFRKPRGTNQSSYAGIALLLLLAAPLFAAEPVTALEQLASSLSQNDSAGALAVFDSKMPGFSTVESGIDALVFQTDILCSIEVLEEKDAVAGDGGAEKEMELDLYLRLKSQAPSGQVERRRERINVRMKILRGRWKIIAIAPLDIFAPIAVK